MAAHETVSEYPCSLCISTPFPTNRLAQKALNALQVDAELSPLVRRSFSLRRIRPIHDRLSTEEVTVTAQSPSALSQEAEDTSDLVILQTRYMATTNRMLRVAVNGFMESLALVVRIMEELDVDVLAERFDVRNS